eukprot:XP_002258233.1 hypothetical protein, conserved in Plasmodium species [Plasmodium knowlesi strain H]
MIDIILKMLLGKYFEPCDKNFITMNMNAGIEIRNIIIKNDEINQFLKSKNIDIEIVYLKIERIYISFVTLSGMLTLKLHGVDLRLKPHIHRNASKGIKNKLMNLLRRNEGENKTLCCCCESYQDVQDSLCCYNNISKIKTYICKDCSVLKNQDDEAHLAFIKKQVAWENAHQHAPDETSRSVVIMSNGLSNASTSSVGPDLKAKRCRTRHLNSAERIKRYDDMRQFLCKSVMGKNRTGGSMQGEQADHVFAKELVQNQNFRDRFPHCGNLSHINKSGVTYDTSATYAVNGLNSHLQYYSDQMGKNEQIHVSASNKTQHNRNACKKSLRGGHSDGRPPRQGVYVNIGMYAPAELLNGIKNHQDKDPQRSTLDYLYNAHSKLKGKESLGKIHIYDDNMGDAIHERCNELTDHTWVGSWAENNPHRLFHNEDVPCTCHRLNNKCTSMLYSYNGTNRNNCMRIKIDHVFDAKL